MTTVAQQIEAALSAALSPDHLAVIDDSHLHAGHAGARPGGESHFTVEITAAAFTGRSRVARHRLVNTALADLLAGPVHALVIKAKAPGE
ncbi:BolA family transcriptional regulator [Alkalicaulis satelles]|uniref:BolA family transcriptional regulator n=1 Tax=Alkalicaulis satelles TaxID=2609175 RepID=A0A5M6ZKB5_9PROT|nr:BolA family transcriptional regulator [Alkalicaulis satelles]